MQDLCNSEDLLSYHDFVDTDADRVLMVLIQADKLVMNMMKDMATMDMEMAIVLMERQRKETKTLELFSCIWDDTNLHFSEDIIVDYMCEQRHFDYNDLDTDINRLGDGNDR